MNKSEYEKITQKLVKLNQEEQSLVIANMPKFERGVTEASVEREKLVWDDMRGVFDKHNLNPSVNVKLMSENQPSNDPHRPSLVCPGVKVSIEYIVNPVDINGKDGSMPGVVIEELAEIHKKRDKLERDLEMGMA